MASEETKEQNCYIPKREALKRYESRIWKYKC